MISLTSPATEIFNIIIANYVSPVWKGQNHYDCWARQSFNLCLGGIRVGLRSISSPRSKAFQTVLCLLLWNIFPSFRLTVCSFFLLNSVCHGPLTNPLICFTLGEMGSSCCHSSAVHVALGHISATGKDPLAMGASTLVKLSFCTVTSLCE